eukprot:SM000091S24569  [mRNA]  locus=s91:24539:26410:- [translate_table: standard]
MWYRGCRAASASSAASGSDSCSSSSGGDSGVSLVGVNRGAVGLATSFNGLHWSRGEAAVVTNARGEGGTGLVLDCSSNWWTFDTRHVSVSDVLIMSSQKVRAQAGVYWMYYSGGDAEELDLPAAYAGLGYSGKVGQRVEGLRMRPGLAMSNDGRNWARIEGEHHSGALFDVGQKGEWDCFTIQDPHVVYHEAGDIRMYYTSLDPGTGIFSAGFARSSDGLEWLKMGKILGEGPKGAFDEKGVSACQVLQNPDGSGYLMVYEGVAADNSRSIGLATSQDGLHDWMRRGDMPIFCPAPKADAWDSWSVCSPCLVQVSSSEWRMYYVGLGRDGSSGIGLAVSESPLCTFERHHQISVAL